jgi:hypothetical protein
MQAMHSVQKDPGQGQELESMMIIGLDFDGTVVQHDYPEIGDPVPGAVIWLRRWLDAGAHIILWTMRSDRQLEEAVLYLQTHGITLWGINGNPSQKSWTTSPKAHCDLYVDDRAVGVPLAYPPNGGKPHVDWAIVGPHVLRMLTYQAATV